jgi:L-cystine transport system substrate-binding protein
MNFKALLRGASVIFLAAAVSALPACSKAEDKVVYVGTSGSYHPFTYYDDDNNLTGYDVEGVRLLNSKIDGVDLQFTVTGQWDGLVAGMDAGRYDMVANQLAKNPEREEKYIFAENGYVYVETQLVVNGGDNARTDLSEFAGETMGGVVDDYFSEMLEDYNSEHGSPYSMNYYEDYTGVFMDVSNGRIAGTVNDSIVVGNLAKNLGLNIKCVGDVLEDSFSFFMFPRSEAGNDLKKKVDKAMEEVLKDGSLKNLCIEWFGADYVSGR